MLVNAKIDASQITYAERDLMEIYPVEFEDWWVIRGYKGYDISDFVKKWNGTIYDESDLIQMEQEREARRVANEARRIEIYKELAELDTKAIRPLREGETERVAQLAAQSKALRSELAGLV